MNELLTPTWLPVNKNQEDERLTQSHTVAYTRAMRLNDLFTPTLRPIKKSQEGELLTPALLPI